ncbi:MAG TPA: redoxin domain-containing protein [Symbiobacteriaceae bacterium]|jgi:peroxiredoxin
MTAEVIRYPAYKRITAAIILALFVIWVGYVLLVPTNTSKAPGTGIAVGAKAPDFELKGIDGKSYKLSDLKGKAVMIDFFATWCPSCREEIPLLQETYKTYQGQGFVILAVDMQEQEKVVKQFQQEKGITFPIVLDAEEKVTKMYDIVPLPTAYFVDKNGVVQAKWTGSLTRPQLLQLIKKVL